MHCETVTLIGWNHCQREGNMTIYSPYKICLREEIMAHNVLCLYGMNVLGGIYS